MNPRYSGSHQRAILGHIAVLLAAGILPGAMAVAQCDPSANPNMGCFTSVTPTAQTQLLVYPSATHTFQMLAKSNITKYSFTNNFIGGTNDFTGYVGKLIGPNTRSSMDGYLSINHETTPGGVSMLSLVLNGSSALWNLTYVKKVDYTPVVQSTRNCSGTVTPWGTIISSEETFTSTDANADGYADVGWNVEIDPVSGLIKDQDGDGKPDKLWAMGRMSHENVVVASDNITVYQGEDGGTGGVYKYVANTPGDLSSGTLYVLKKDAPAATSTTGTWVQVPNTSQSDRNNTPARAQTAGGFNWGGVEDVEIGPDGKIYFTEKNQGRIWRFNDNGTTISNIETFVGPSSMNYPIQTANGTVNENWGAGIDNLAFDGEGNLWALQDGGRDHIWMIRPNHVNTVAGAKVELFATTPAGSEPTGITFSPDYRYMFISLQNPNSGNTQSQMDIEGNSVVWNSSTTIVIARKEFLGPLFINDERLQVELSGFNIREYDGLVSLSWHTASEVDNAGFEIERANGTEGEFERIASFLNDSTLRGLGTSSMGKSYFYSESEHLTPGVYRYRLLDVSTDGVRTAHEEHAIVIEESDAAIAGSAIVGSVTPNPSPRHLTLPFNFTEPATITIDMYDASGRLMLTPVRGEQFGTGTNTFEFDTRDLAPGKYYLDITTPSGHRIRPFVITR
jgi:secreted PhoX family phosphatase